MMTSSPSYHRRYEASTEGPETSVPPTTQPSWNRRPSRRRVAERCERYTGPLEANIAQKAHVRPEITRAQPNACGSASSVLMIVRRPPLSACRFPARQNWRRATATESTSGRPAVTPVLIATGPATCSEVATAAGLNTSGTGGVASASSPSSKVRNAARYVADSATEAA